MCEPRRVAADRERGRSRRRVGGPIALALLSVVQPRLVQGEAIDIAINQSCCPKGDSYGRSWEGQLVPLNITLRTDLLNAPVSSCAALNALRGLNMVWTRPFSDS